MRGGAVEKGTLSVLLSQGHYRTTSPEVPASINAEVMDLARALRWVGLDLHELLREILLLKHDMQRGWYFTLFVLCGTSPIPGYLRVSAHPNLWRVVGAHSGRSWESHGAAVLACFHSAEIDGEKYLYHPLLLRAIAKAVEKLHKRQVKSTDSTGPPFSTGGEQLPLLLFSVLKGKEKPKGKSASRSVAKEDPLHERIAEQFERLRKQRAGAR